MSGPRYIKRSIDGIRFIKEKAVRSDIIFYYRKIGIRFMLNFGFLALILHRFGHSLYNRYRLINPLWYLYLFLRYFQLLLLKIELPASCQIGKNLYLPHAYGLVMNGHVSIGDDCIIGPYVVLGHLKGVGTGVPRIESNVYIGPKATILGPVVVGRNCIVGAHALVIKDMKPNSVAYGAIATIKDPDGAK